MDDDFIIKTETENASSAAAEEANPLDDLISMEPIRQKEVVIEAEAEADPFSDVLEPRELVKED